jgi:hypothetical protein
MRKTLSSYMSIYFWDRFLVENLNFIRQGMKVQASEKPYVNTPMPNLKVRAGYKKYNDYDKIYCLDSINFKKKKGTCSLSGFQSILC